MVFGPPGTGKSTYLARNIQKRVDALGIETVKKTTAVLSFTRTAAQEISSRIDPQISSSTMHSLCYRACGFIKDQVIGYGHLEEFSKLVNIKFSHKSLEDSEEETPGDVALSIEALARSRMVTIGEVYDKMPNRIDPALLKYVIKSYRKWKFTRGYIDFTDMLERSLKEPGLLYKTLIVDEAQDLSNLQFAVLDHWIAQGVEEVILAGDDDQAIYVWGGAEPSGMFRFEKQYMAERVVLSQSYRLPETVHNLAVRISESITERVEKKFAPREETGTINEIPISALSTVAKHGEDVMILYRCHSMRRELEKLLIFAGAPYMVLSGPPGALESQYKKAIDIYDRVLYYLKKGEPISLLNREERILQKFTNPAVWNILKSGKCESLFGLGWETALNIPPFQKIYFKSVVRRYGDLDVVPTIKLSTIHGAKGREADTIVLLNSISGRIRESINYDGQDFEKRVFYVGVTRAKKKLYVINGEIPLMWKSGPVTW